MILSRSPFYYNVVHPNAFVTSVDFTLVVAEGSLATPTALQTYNFTKLKPSDTTTNTYIDIAPYIRDSYNNQPITDKPAASLVVDGSDVLIAVVTAQATDSLGNNLTPSSNKYKCADGYGYYLDGQNNQPSNKILLSHQEYKADYRGYFIVPLNCASGDADPTVDGVGVALGFTEDVTNYIKYLVIPCAEYQGSITVVFGGETIFIELIEECKYEVKEFQFLNRFGAMESIHFYKSSMESLSVKSNTFKNNYTNGVSYDTSIHQIKRTDVTANKSIKVETGFLNPYYNETIQELLQSEKVWMNAKPVNIKTESLEFKTRAIDKLISYSLDFDYAFDEINNV
jgi:hypothetical protein